MNKKIITLTKQIIYRIKSRKINLWMTRPFQIKDLLPIPDGWEVTPPHFVGIALGKAGTSWWWKLLQEHPSVKPNRLRSKELSFFCHFGYHGITSQDIFTYQQAFAAPVGHICGEWTPGYLQFPLAISYLKKAAPDTKLLAIVRNPVDRVVSLLNEMLTVRAKRVNLKGQRAYIYRTFSIYPEAIKNNFLYESFRRVFKLFDRSQLLLLQYEKCVLNPAEEISKTYRFLGIDEKYKPKNPLKKVNLKPYIVPKLTNDKRARLTEYFFEDVKAFVKLCPEIDLSLWSDFRSS